MAVNALVTGLIAFRILKVFSELKATTTTSVERTLGSTSHGGTKSQHIVFIIIESGMMLLVVQLVRLVLEVIVAPNQFATPGPVDFAFNYMDGVGQICIVIIRSVHFYFFCFTEKNYLARASHQHLFSCGSYWVCPSLKTAKNLSRKLSEVFILIIIPQAIRIYEREVVAIILKFDQIQLRKLLRVSFSLLLLI